MNVWMMDGLFDNKTGSKFLLEGSGKHQWMDDGWMHGWII
jgi:hypothetical protein